MAVTNRIAKAAPAKEQPKPVIFQAGGMEVKLTPAIVKNYLVSGNKDRVSDQEVAMFINLCKYSSLNPWLKEAYCIKYGDEPATMVVGKEAFMKRAESHPEFDGFEAGIIVITEEGDVDTRPGTLTVPGEKIIGGWAEVYRKDRSHSIRSEVGFDEYAGRKKDGSLNGQWSKKPATMIRKVALVQALREAFPASLGGLYSAEEMGQVEPEMNQTMEQPSEAKMPEIQPETGEIIDAEVVSGLPEADSLV